MIQTLRWSDKDDRHLLLESVRKKELFIGTTDTVLGLMGSIDAQVQEKIDYVKHRREKPYIILQDAIEKVSLLAAMPSLQIEIFLKHCWPGPVTAILPKSPHAPAFIGTQETVAIRIPQHEGLLDLLAHLPYGIYSTSANISGQPIPRAVDEVAPAILNSCRYYVTDDLIKELPSTIIDCTQGDLRLVREGAYPMARLLDLYKNLSN